MDILTERGQETVRQEQQAIKLFLQKYPNFDYVETPKNEPCPADGFIIKDKIVVGLVETKCRVLTFDKLRQYDFEWLITMQKIMDCVKIAEQLHIPFIGFLYLVPDKTLLVKKIWCNQSGFLVDFHVSKTVTQATVNGGRAERANAYIKMTDATILKSDE